MPEHGARVIGRRHPDERGVREDGGLGVVTTHNATKHTSGAAWHGMEWDGMNEYALAALACERPCRCHELNAEQASDDAMQ